MKAFLMNKYYDTGFPVTIVRAGQFYDEKAGSVVFDNTKVKRLVPEMKTNIPFSEGVRVALDHILSHTDEYEEDPMFDKFCDKVIDALEETWTRLTISLYGQIDTI